MKRKIQRQLMSDEVKAWVAEACDRRPISFEVLKDAAHRAGLHTQEENGELYFFLFADGIVWPPPAPEWIPKWIFRRLPNGIRRRMVQEVTPDQYHLCWTYDRGRRALHLDLQYWVIGRDGMTIEGIEVTKSLNMVGGGDSWAVRDVLRVALGLPSDEVVPVPDNFIYDDVSGMVRLRNTVSSASESVSHTDAFALVLERIRNKRRENGEDEN